MVVLSVSPMLAIGVADWARNYRPVVFLLNPAAALKAREAPVVFAMWAVGRREAPRLIK